jgi:hypothetical protein
MSNQHKYGICLGPWGDIICSLGHFSSLLNSKECIYYGYLTPNQSVLDFLDSQPYITRSHYVSPTDLESYKAHVSLMWSSDSQLRRTGIGNALSHTDFDSSLVEDTNLNYGFSGYDAPEIPLAPGINVPDYCKTWAQDVASYLPRPFYLIQPYSINTNQMIHHWPHWSEYMRWMLHDQTKHYVTCGLGWDDSKISKLHNTTRLVGKTPTVMHMWALASLADAVITTSNSLAHYCAANNIKTIVLAAERNSEPTEYFRQVIKGSNILFFNKFSSYFKVCYDTKDFLNIWPEITTG